MTERGEAQGLLAEEDVMGFIEGLNKATCCATAAAQLCNPPSERAGTCVGHSAASPVLRADENHQ